MKKLLPIAIVGALLSGCAATGSDQEINKLRLKLTELETNQRIIASQLKMQSVTGVPTEIQFGDGIAFGDPKAPVAMIEFTDIQCPYCAKFEEETFPEFKAKYIDTGKVYYVAREMPLQRIHPEAFGAAVALRCAAEQNTAAYKSMKKDFFENQKELSPQYYSESAQSHSLNIANFEKCIDGKDNKNAVAQSYKYAISIGVQSTPSFVFGHNTGYSAEDYKMGAGAMTLEQIDEAIELFITPKETK